MFAAKNIYRTKDRFIALCNCSLFIVLLTIGNAIAKENDYSWYKKAGYTILNGKKYGILSQGEYLVPDSLIVPIKRMLTIEAGTQLYFMTKAKFSIKGTCTLQGNANSPIMCAHLAKEKYQPETAPPDYKLQWQGIVLDSTGSIAIRHTQINGAVQGITTPKNPNLMCDMVVFTHCQVNAGIGDKILDISDGTPFAIDLGKKTPTPDNTSKIKRSFQVSAGAVTTAGIIMWVVGYNQARQLSTDYKTAHSNTDIKTIYASNKTKRILSGIGAGLAALGAAGICVSFTF
jgi:hypothetical protein